MKFNQGKRKSNGHATQHLNASGNAVVPIQAPAIRLSQEFGFKLVGAVFIISSIFTSALVLAGVFDELDISRSAIIGTSIIGVVAGSLFYWAGTRKTNPLWMHAVPLVAFAELYMLLSNSGAAEPRLLLGYSTALIWVVIFMSDRAFAGYTLLVTIIFGLTYAKYYDDGTNVLPIIVTSVSLITTCVVTVIVRRQLDRVALQAGILSGHDPLTGLPNLQPLHGRINLMMQKAQRENGSVSVLMIDLDGFKTVNDRYSHSTGDQTLRAVARAMRRVVREDEMVARRGGDEFTIATEAASQADVAALIE
ncbi:MAG: GGDEF domain-containing protein, partial [Thermoleophilaceae bacterium]|nr:GGDEF domain-containing protein [Thermoleophilaceae bacterium]